jgi:hypothetical protein
MLDERAETSDERSEEPYEPPAVIRVGTMADVAVAPDSSLTLDSPESDRVLKEDVATVARPLELLRAIRTR